MAFWVGFLVVTDQLKITEHGGESPAGALATGFEFDQQLWCQDTLLRSPVHICILALNGVLAKIHASHTEAKDILIVVC